MTDDASWDGLVGDLYLSALDAEARARLPSALTGLVRGVTVAMWAADPRTGRPVSEMVTNLPCEAEALYRAHYHRLDPWLGSPALRRIGRVQHGAELVPDAVLARSEFYNDFGRRIGSFHVLGCCAPIGDDPGAPHGTLSVLRPRESGAFGTEEAGRLRRLVPHLRRAWQVGQRLGAAPSVPRGDAGALLDGLRAAAVVADGHGRARLANAAAERLDAAGALRLRGAAPGAPVALPRAEDTRRLRAAVADAAGGGAGHEWLAGADGPGRLRVTVSPLPRAVLGAALGAGPGAGPGAVPGGAGWALILVTPEALPRGEETLRRARRLFGFTRTEAEVALALADGMSPGEIAAGRDVMITTVRSQLRRALEKTGTNDLRGLAIRMTLLRD